MKRNNIPLHYLFYNPPKIPLQITVPIKNYKRVTANPPLGARIVPAPTILKLLDNVDYWPTITDVDEALPANPKMHFGGWRLEQFMADLLLSCREGKRFVDAEEQNLFDIFYRRTGPIAASVAVTVEMPEDADLPD